MHRLKRSEGRQQLLPLFSIYPIIFYDYLWRDLKVSCKNKLRHIKIHVPLILENIIFQMCGGDQAEMVSLTYAKHSSKVESTEIMHIRSQNICVKSFSPVW